VFVCLFFCYVFSSFSDDDSKFDFVVYAVTLGRYFDCLIGIDDACCRF